MIKYKNYFEHNNCKIDLIGLGTYNLQNYLCEKSVSSALEIGYRLIDTAKIYNNEKFIGNALSKSNIKRKDLFLTSKISIKTKNKDIKSELQKSIDDLKTDYLDLYLIHWPIFDTNLYDILSILEDLKEKKLIKQYGVSNFNISLLRECVKNSFKIFCNQIEFHPFINQKNLILEMEKLNIIAVAYRTLLKGNIKKNNRLYQIAKKYNRSIFQIILNWTNRKNIISIPMSSNYKHLKENFNSLNFNIDNDDIIYLDSLHKYNIRDVKNISKYEWDL